MKWLAATALTTAMVTGFLMFDGGAFAQTSSTSGTTNNGQSRSSAQTESMGKPAAGATDRTGQPGFQGNQPPNVTSSGPQANAPAQNTPAGANNNNRTSGSASVSGNGSVSGGANMSASGNNTTGTGGAMTNKRTTTTGSASTKTKSSTSASRSNDMNGMDMSSGSTRSTSKSTARKASTTHSGSAGASNRSRSMGTASRASRDSGNRETSALNWLSAAGYRDVKELRQQGNGYVATVNKDGRSQQVTVDPANGRISPAS